MREIVYDNYYWQNELVRLRAWSEDDWEWDYYNSFDSSAERLGSYNVDLPPTVSGSKEYSSIFSGQVNMTLSLNGIAKQALTFAINKAFENGAETVA